MSKKKQRISRKQFLKHSIAAGVGFGIYGKTSFGKTPFVSSIEKLSGSSASSYRILGKTGIKVMPLGFGAARTMEPALVKRALDNGMDFLDTGRGYFNGQNEVMLGKLLKGLRKEVVIQSKIKVRFKQNSLDLKSGEISGKIEKMLGASLFESLKALQTDYIDVMLIHGARSEDLIHHDTIMEFFMNAKKEGKIRACGFSSHSNQVALLKAANQSKFYDVIMVPYTHKGSYIHSKSGHYREWNQPMLEQEMTKAEKNGTAIIAMKTCSAGPCSREKGKEPTYEEALRWVFRNSAVRAAAVAMANFEQIKENMEALKDE